MNNNWNFSFLSFFAVIALGAVPSSVFAMPQFHINDTPEDIRARTINNPNLCESYLSMHLNDQDFSLLRDIMEMISLSDGHFVRHARVKAKDFNELLLWYQMSAGFSVFPYELNRNTSHLDQPLLNMMAISVPTGPYKESSKDWLNYTQNLVHNMYVVWTAFEPLSKTQRTLRSLGASRKTNLAQWAVRKRVSSPELSMRHPDSLSYQVIAKLNRLKLLMGKNQVVAIYLAQRMPALLRIRDENWQSLFGSRFEYLGIGFNRLPNPKLDLSELDAPATPRLTNQSTQTLPKTQKPNFDDELKSLNEWIESATFELNELPSSVEGAQSLLAPLRNGSRGISDLLFAAPTPPEARDLSAYWEQNRQDPKTARQARTEIRKWHDQARADLVALEKIANATEAAVIILETRLDQYVASIKAANTSPEAFQSVVLSGLVHEAELIKINAQQSRLAVRSRLQRQSSWIESLVLIEAISSLPQEPQQQQQPSDQQLSLPPPKSGNDSMVL
jgi:hypothetical protein